jgi:hypothetical protein
MAITGPAPKDPSQRARRNKDPIATTVVRMKIAKPQNTLPPNFLPEGFDEWHSATLEWWGVMSRSPLVENLPEVDWQELYILAVVHHLFMSTGELKFAAELRQRTAQFGTTPESRAKLRIQVADANDKELKLEGRGGRAGKLVPQSARERFAGLAAVQEASADVPAKKAPRRAARKVS